MMSNKKSLKFYMRVSVIAVTMLLPENAVLASEQNSVFKPIEMQHVDSRVDYKATQTPMLAVPAAQIEEPETLVSQAQEVFSKPFSQFNRSKVSDDEMEALKDETKFPKPFSSSSSPKPISQPEKAVKIEVPEIPQQKVVNVPRPPEKSKPEIEMVREDTQKIPPVQTQRVEKVANVIDVSKQQESKNAQKQALKAQAEQAEKNTQATNDELDKVRQEMVALEKENRALYIEARQARGQIDAAVVETSNEALKKLRAYEKKLEAAQADNLYLSREIEEMRRIQEDQQFNLASGDPDAQQSIRRYNEAQREIQRLGKLLEQQRLAHRQEKIELENMLFDPAVTDEAQREKLSILEAKLSEAQMRIKQETQKAAQVNVEREKELEKLSQELSKAKEKENSLKLEAEKIQAEAKKIAAAEAKLVALMEKEEALKLKEKRLQAEQKQIEQAEVKISLAEQKQKELLATQAKIKLQEQHMAAEKALQAIQPAARNISTSNVGGVANAVSPSSYHIQLKSMLNRSGLSSVSAIRKQGQGYYYWKAAGMTGKAQIASSSQKNMSQFVQNYIAREKQNCRGDFASLPAPLSSGKRGYELACINGSQGKSASVLFTQQGNDIIAIAHETTADNMDAAIDARDKVASQL